MESPYLLPTAQPMIGVDVLEWICQVLNAEVAIRPVNRIPSTGRLEHRARYGLPPGWCCCILRTVLSAPPHAGATGISWGFNAEVMPLSLVPVCWHCLVAANFSLALFLFGMPRPFACAVGCSCLGLPVSFLRRVVRVKTGS